jgi:small acid-soluble spore protein D (minor alpha/beta-type SASP)
MGAKRIPTPRLDEYRSNKQKRCSDAHGKDVIMASNKTMIPEAKEAMNQFKMEAANEVGVNLKQGYNGDLTSRQAGSVGGQMVKKMIESYENSLKK